MDFIGFVLKEREKNKKWQKNIYRRNIKTKEIANKKEKFQILLRYV